MRNLIIALVAVLVVLLGIAAYKHFSSEASKNTASAPKETPVAAPLTSPNEKSTAEKPTDKKIEEAAAKVDPGAKKATDAVMKADQVAAGGDKEKAARAYAVILEEMAGKADPWKNNAAELEAARSKHASAIQDLLFNPAGDWKSTKYTVTAGDSLEKIRRKVMEASASKPVTVGMIRKANRLEKDILHPGEVLRVPLESWKAIVDRSSYSVRVYFGDLLVRCYRVGLGKEDKPTPTGLFIVGEKQKNPTWFPKGEKPVPYTDPANPLGTRWIALKQNGAPTGYGIHGTNDDKAVGASISQGCIRMYNKDVEELFDILPEGSIVEIR